MSSIRKHQKLMVVLCIVVNLFGLRAAEDIVSIDCSNEEIVTSVFNDPIALTLNGIVHVYENVTINNITATTNNEFDKNYIDARLMTATDNSTGVEVLYTNLVIYTTEQFRRYAEEQTVARITLKIVFGCDMGRERTLIFFQPIREGNYFSPKFSQDTYELIMPTPIFAGFDLTTLMQITARDDDLTANRITFTSADSSGFNIEVATKNQTSADKKTYYAELRLSRIFLSLASELRFQIVATDNGEPPLSSNATIVVRTNPAISLPPTPQFTDALASTSLSANLTLVSFNVSLTPETYTQDVEFSMAGVDAQLFAIRSADHVVFVTLAHPLNRSVVKDKKFLQFELNASNRKIIEVGRMAILVEVPSFKEHFHFERTHYEGSIDQFGTLTIDAIVFNNASYIDGVEFSLDNGTIDAKFFTLQHRGNIVRLSLSQNFSMDLAKNTSQLIFEVHSALGDLKASTRIYITLPPATPAQPAAPQFEKSLYHGKILTAPVELLIETMTLKTHSSMANTTQFELMGDDRDLFVLFAANQSVNLMLKGQPSAGDLQANPVILMTLVARTELNATASTVIAIEMPAIADRSTRIFTENWMVAQVAVNETGVETLSMPAVQLASNFTVSQFNFSVEGSESNYFRITQGEDEQKLYLFLLQPLPTVVLQTLSHLRLLLKAVSLRDATQRDSLPIFVELPRTVCAAANVSSTPPKFSSDEYIFSARPNQVGVLGVVSATVQSATALVQYKIRIEDEHLEKRMTINVQSGALMLIDYINPGNYSFNITADNLASAQETTVKARLEVSSLMQCVDGRRTVADMLLVKHLPEEQPHYNVLNLTTSSEECMLHLEGFQPNDKAYVYVNESTGMLNTLAIDRESSVFSAMPQPRLQVKLRLICGNDTSTANSSFLGATTTIIPANIAYSSDVTYMNLLISDINDNSPQFVYPTETLHLGYPDPSINVNIFPQYLTQLHATDRDAGDNASIRYTIQSNPYYDIDSATGIIYPKATALPQSTAYVELTVQAADRAGLQDNTTTRTTTAPKIIVHRLRAEHYALLTFKNSTGLSLEQQLQQLTKETGYMITMVKQGILPISNSSRGGYPQARQAVSGSDEIIVQKAWAYAFDNGQPVDFRQLQSKLQSLPNAVEHLMLESFNEALTTTSDAQTADAATLDTTSYIVVIVVLTLISLSTGGYLLWHLYLSKFYCSQKAGNKLTSDIECESVNRTNSCNVHGTNAPDSD